MTNTAVNNKRYGFNAEAELVTYLRDKGGWIGAAERLHLAGTEDEGDLVLYYESNASNMESIIVQLKTFSSRSKTGAERPLTPGRIKGWLRDLDAQREAYRAHRGLDALPGGILVVKFKGTSWDDALVINSLGRWAG